MKKVAEIAMSILGLYLIISAISEQARSSWGSSLNAGIRDYLFMFGPSFILLIGGILCICFRSFISGWMLRWQNFEIPESVDINRIECVVLTLLGIYVVLGAIPYFILSVNNLFLSPEVQKTEYGTLPFKSYAIVQVIAAATDLLISLMLIFFPKKVQSILRKTRNF
jgi:hypothetical protein